jgi:hypothetical protein
VSKIANSIDKFLESATLYIVSPIMMDWSFLCGNEWVILIIRQTAMRNINVIALTNFVSKKVQLICSYRPFLRLCPYFLSVKYGILTAKTTIIISQKKSVMATLTAINVLWLFLQSLSKDFGTLDTLIYDRLRH